MAIEALIQENQLFVGVVALLVVGAFCAFFMLGGARGWSDDGCDGDFGDWD